ncbi:MAG: winged helix-turn-helix transcriptional regulator [Candidatus Micrarchaeota archaeon]|nr:winged helix-turn-helix transcriptional regulator [Candidatus Micrarchaeota archaeon]
MDVFYALAEPNRRRIVELLAGRGSLTATEICDKFNITAQAVSQHLKVLRETKLVTVERHAQQRIYQLNPETIGEVERWTLQMKQQWEERFQRLDEVLANEKKRNARKR